MITIIRNKKIRWGMIAVFCLSLLLIPAVAIGHPRFAPSTGTNASGLVCTQDTGTTSPTFDLETATGYIEEPDGNQVFMWGYRLAGTSFQIPSPVLCVNQGDTVTINLSNTLPEPVSIIFPGQMGVTSSGDANGGMPGLLTHEAAASSGAASYTFTASEPGTYLYESGSNQHKQVHMGLYGVLIVRPSLGANYAYNDPATEFGDEFLLVLHEIDPDLHQQVEFGLPYNVTTRHDRYWTINGRSSTDDLLDNFVPWLPHQPYGALVRVEAYDSVINPGVKPALIRFANAGTVNHPFHPHGDTMNAVGRDGRPLGAAGFEDFTSTIGGGQTIDLLFRWENVEGWIPGPNGQIPENNRFPFPGLQNLVFKDDVTFYSGNPYLGQQGAFPTGVTSFNECGEFYFPWHSHALQEIVNFDEGFGGMLTLVRVDPPGGCP
jgi:FtsP/CotA-like multicopper oxidase with cupredoxin domain